jgi:hypothetical protein
MKKVYVISTVLVLLFVLGAGAKLTGFKFIKKEASKDNVSIFKVPLVCGAAPHIGCGSESKPVLLEFEKDAEVVSAWLNRTGTEMAVVWKDGVKKEDKAAKVKAVFGKFEISYEELGGEDYNKSFDGFASGKEWYKGKDVDKLSEEEAWTIADKVANGVKAKVELSSDKEQKLKSDVADVCAGAFLAAGNEDKCDHKQMIENFYGKTGGYLNENEMAALKGVVNDMFTKMEIKDEGGLNERMKDCNKDNKDGCCKDKK